MNPSSSTAKVTDPLQMNLTELFFASLGSIILCFPARGESIIFENHPTQCRKAIEGYPKIAVTFPLAGCTITSYYFSDDRHLLHLLSHRNTLSCHPPIPCHTISWLCWLKWWIGQPCHRFFLDSRRKQGIWEPMLPGTSEPFKGWGSICPDRSEIWWSI